MDTAVGFCTDNIILINQLFIQVLGAQGPYSAIAPVGE